MKYFFLSIRTAIGSLFGIHSKLIQQPTGFPVITAQTSTSSPTSNQSSNNQPPAGSKSNDTPQMTQVVASSQVDTNGWLTYSSQEYGIVLKYPAEWDVKATSTPSIGNIDIIKDGYDLSFQLCDRSQTCYQYEPGTLEVSPNAQLAPSIHVSLIIGGRQAWRTVQPIGSWDDSIYGNTPYFSFTFLRDTTATSDPPGFNDRTKYTPISESMELNDIYYTINYSLPYPVTKTDYDHSIINQMDAIVQNAVFIRQ